MMIGWMTSRIVSMASKSIPLGPVSETLRTPTVAGWLPVSISEYEAFAKDHLPRNAFDYFSSGAEDMQTLRENLNAFSRLRLRPRMLRNVSNLSTMTTILGQNISFPICLSPSAMHKMAHPEGEIATAKAAKAADTCMILSSLSTTSLEQVAEANDDGLRWFQLYVYSDRSLTEQLVKRAERAGYKAIVLTVDTPVLGRRESDIRNQFKLPSHLRLENFQELSIQAEGVKDGGDDSGLSAYIARLFDRSLGWSDIAWLKSITSLPIVAKGILTAEDTYKAIEAGVDAILVSNHGARQLDGVPATIEALPEVLQASGGRVEVYLDGGIRRGTDVIKALAIGARAVFIGRPVLWGLAHDGSNGVKRVLDLLRNELEISMLLLGSCSIRDIKTSQVVHESYYQNLLSSFIQSHSRL